MNFLFLEKEKSQLFSTSVLGLTTSLIDLLASILRHLSSSSELPNGSLLAPCFLKDYTIHFHVIQSTYLVLIFSFCFARNIQGFQLVKIYLTFHFSVLSSKAYQALTGVLA